MALKVLSALDTAKIQYYHFKAIIIAGMGLFTDAYDLFCISPILKMIQRIYFKDEPMKASVASVMVAIAFLGTAIGQLVFGRLGDRMGRRHVYGLALLLMVMSSIGCGFSVCTTRNCVLVSLGFFRFLLGIGIGGDYPLSATIMSEFANRRTRGAFIAAVFSMQGLGILASCVVTMVVCSVFGSVASSEHPSAVGADIAWRLILMLGAVPAGLTFYWRIRMPETARYTALVENNVLQAAKDMEKVLELPLAQISEDSPFPPPCPPAYSLLSKKFFRRHGVDLISCSLTWFLIDVVFYSTNLFLSQIYNISDEKETNPYRAALKVAKLQAIVAVLSTIPGYWVTVYLIDRIGRVKIQLIGFFFMAVVYIAVGIPYNYWEKHTNAGFMVLYGLTFFFANFGPNTTTFIVPAELFPARFRSTCHGIAGAVGKMGAIFGTVMFLLVTDDKKSEYDKKGYPRGRRMTVAFVALGGACILGFVITYFFMSETMGRSLEENEKDEDENGEGDGDRVYFLRCFTRSNLLRTTSF